MMKEMMRPGPAFLRADRSQHENAGADDAADAEQGQLDRAQGALQRLLLGGGEDGVEWLNAPEYHACSP
jgi:hypothetical protein